MEQNRIDYIRIEQRSVVQYTIIWSRLHVWSQQADISAAQVQKPFHTSNGYVSNACSKTLAVHVTLIFTNAWSKTLAVHITTLYCSFTRKWVTLPFPVERHMPCLQLHALLCNSKSNDQGPTQAKGQHWHTQSSHALLCNKMTEDQTSIINLAK